MARHTLWTIALVASASAFAVGRSDVGVISRESVESQVDPRLVFSSHPLLGVVPVPVTPDEIEAAKKPGYLDWSHSQSTGKRGSLASRFETAEHAFLGDSLVLQGPNGTDLPPLFKFTLPNGVSVTYGEINCLAGDFYGTYDPISDGTSLEDQINRFNAAYALLATDSTRQPKEANDILAAAANERQVFAAAVANGSNPSAAYASLPDTTAQLELITITRPLDQPGYLGLAAINFDHFGADARTAYNAGHTAALRAAAAGNLLTGYTLNAFADHFLEDSFASGHLRTPRRFLHSGTRAAGPSDLCAKYMHDEDNALGLAVTNPRGASWTSYGDKYLLDGVGLDNAGHAREALRISTAEVLAAFKTGVVPAVGTYGAWAEAPTLESARGPQALVPLFREDGQRRVDVKDRRRNEFTNFYTFLTTIVEIQVSGKWSYPFTF